MSIDKNIPLTKEVLKRYGFYCDYDNQATRKGIILHKYSYKEGYFINTEKLSSPIEYLHQLQSLYFILIGEELKEV